MQRIGEKLKAVFESIPEVKLVYLFGSRARKQEGDLSDYDFAVYIEERDREKLFEIRINLMNKIAKTLQTDKVDLLILNSQASPDIKYFAIKEGILIYENEFYRVKIEPRILNEYFDFEIMLRKNNLTMA